MRVRQNTAFRWSIVSIIIGLMVFGGLSAPAAAQGESCSEPVGIVNSGFEQPSLTPSERVDDPTLPGWDVTATVELVGPSSAFDSGSQVLILGGGGSQFLGQVTQELDGSVLRGEEVTFTIASVGTGAIALDGAQSQTIADSTANVKSFVFDVPSSAPDELTLTLFSYTGWQVDEILATYSVSCPDPNPSGSFIEQLLALLIRLIEAIIEERIGDFRN